MNGPAVSAYEFSGFRVDTARRLLIGPDTQPIGLKPKVFETLLYLLEHRGELCDKRQLMRAVWPGLVVEENNLNQNISTLRRVLGEQPGEHRFIVTEPGRGYRFVASVIARAAGTESLGVPVGPVAVDSGSRAPVGAKRLVSRASVAIGLAIAVALAGALWYLLPKRDAPLPNSIAVLPFENLSPDPDDAFFAVGLHGEILNQLTKISALNVIGQPSMLRYVGTDQSVQEISSELNVQTVLEASVRYADTRVRITAQLIEAATGRSLWSETYERAFDDVFAVESEIAMEVANALAAEFSLAEQKAIEKPPTKSPAAYQAYLRALNAAPVTALVLEYLDEATRLDPEFALAYARQADVYARGLYAQGGGNEAADPSEWLELEGLARAAAGRALDLDDDMWLAHVALGTLAENRWRWSEALEEYGRAALAIPRGEWRRDLNPFLHDLDFVAAIRQQREVVALNPSSGGDRWILGLWYAYSGDAVAAADAFRDAVTLAPDNVPHHTWLAHAERMLGNSEEALRELRRAEQLPFAHDSSIGIVGLAYAYAQNGRSDDALRLFDVLAEKAPDRRHQAGNWALAYLAVGDQDGARRSLETVIEKIAAHEPEPGFLTLRLIRTNMYKDPVLEEPTFRALRAELRGR